ncbi:DUF4124 domain-containing protein [Herminiimonas sp. NPDC097707]|uniref:DUF4124 domain-containing protein n=1 Tax=Herminiimonas sp. NPDC097707 TaxID=3364007 RepID=UPI00383AEC9D
MKRTLFAFALVFVAPAVMAQAPIYKCISKGKTVYSESPCPVGTNKQSMIDTTPEYMGNETFSRDTINSARARIREGMNQPGATGTSTGSAQPTGNKKYVCDSVKQDLDNLDAAARQPNSSSGQDWIKQRKLETQKTAIEWKC